MAQLFSEYTSKFAVKQAKECSSSACCSREASPRPTLQASSWLLVLNFGEFSFFVFCLSFFFQPQSFWSASDREETQQTSDYLPALPGSFHHFSSLAHDSFTLRHFTHSYIGSRLHIFFFLLSSPLAPVQAPANFMEGQSLENPQGRWKQSGDSYLFPK